MHLPSDGATRRLSFPRLRWCSQLLIVSTSVVVERRTACPQVCVLCSHVFRRIFAKIAEKAEERKDEEEQQQRVSSHRTFGRISAVDCRSVVVLFVDSLDRPNKLTAVQPVGWTVFRGVEARQEREHLKALYRRRVEVGIRLKRSEVIFLASLFWLQLESIDGIEMWLKWMPRLFSTRHHRFSCRRKRRTRSTLMCRNYLRILRVCVSVKRWFDC